MYGSVPNWLQLTHNNTNSRSILHLHNNHLSGGLPLNTTNDQSNDSNLIVIGNRFRKLSDSDVPPFINYKFKNIQWMFVSNEDIIFSWISTILLSLFGLLIITFQICRRFLCFQNRLHSVKQSFSESKDIAIMKDLRQIISLIINLFIVIYCVS